jgi:hypothetical protein
MPITKHALSNGSEVWTIREKTGLNPLCHFQHQPTFTDQEMSEDIWKELQINIIDRIWDYRHKWWEYNERMEENHIQIF